MKKQTQTCQVVQLNDSFPFSRFSLLNRLKRTVGYCLRFAYNCKHSLEPINGSFQL
ncbi:hypothetical protein NQ314_006482 [Rhamnusium bicolor]|uniref:Uncharacterized protein n=1 Tax=Rhamnusium bicolor TaxID=1586634 RepID=A0AAV8Z2E2_9CUCU|nr:hypothetical protein NQ314_006482 [Rhamnusium bicolor]